LETPAQRSRANIRNLQATEQTLQQRIKDLEFELSLVEAHTKNSLRDANIPVGPSAPSSVPESPGPHCLQPKPTERPADIAYRQKLEQQRHAESALNEPPEALTNSPNQLLTIFKSLTKVLQNNNDHLQSSDVSEPSKLNGLDTQWDDFYLRLRTYLEAKGWLLTFEHPHVPGSPGLDNEINKKIYNKLLTLCRKGTAATYITKAALSNGWEAARYLLDRYEGFSKQREKFFRNLVDNLRHVNGTNISRHVDRFEKICGLIMAHNNPSKPPTEEEKIDWFLASVTERTYESVHTSCTGKQLEGTLTFAKVIKLYTHRCFQRYPHFQLDDLDAAASTKPLSNNSNSTFIRSPKGKGKGQGRGRNPQQHHHNSRGRSQTRHSSSRPSRPSNQKGRGKGKPSDHRGSHTPRDNRKPKEVTASNPPTGDPCSYCGRNNHNARNCYKRQEDEKKKSHSSHTHAHQSILVDETAFQFSQSVLSISHSDFNPHHHGTGWGEYTQKREDPQEQDIQGEAQQQANEESYQDTASDEKLIASPATSGAGSISALTVANTKEVSNTECQQIKDSSNKILNEPKNPITLKEDLKDTHTEIDASQSSSSEPSWGQHRSQTQQELEQEWQLWDTTNQNHQQRTTMAYRHGRCECCNKPISTSNLDITYTIFCLGCLPGRVTPENEGIVKDSSQPSYEQGVGKTGRDDEEEWVGIPIPQSDDSDDEYWLDENSGAESDSEQHEADTEPSLLNPRKPDDDPDDASSTLTCLIGTTVSSFTCNHRTEAHVITKY
jgi:hypothetical protein